MQPIVCSDLNVRLIAAKVERSNLIQHIICSVKPRETATLSEQDTWRLKLKYLLNSWVQYQV